MVNVVLVASFSVFGGLFLFVDVFNVPKWMMKYKIQPGTNSPVCQIRLSRINVFTSNVDSDLMPQNAGSDQGLLFVLKLHGNRL